jgi:hypothetical protein
VGQAALFPLFFLRPFQKAVSADPKTPGKTAQNSRQRTGNSALKNLKIIGQGRFDVVMARRVRRGIRLLQPSPNGCFE